MSIINNHALTYATLTNIHYAGEFAFLAFICLIIQILIEIFLAIHYSFTVDMAFIILKHIMRIVIFGWLLRHTQASGASMLFLDGTAVDTQCSSKEL